MNQQIITLFVGSDSDSDQAVKVVQNMPFDLKVIECEIGKCDFDPPLLIKQDIWAQAWDRLIADFSGDRPAHACGQTGINKRSCVESLARHCLMASGLPGDLDNIHAREHLRVFHLENYIGNLTAGDYISYLDQFNTKRQQDIWALVLDESDLLRFLF